MASIHAGRGELDEAMRLYRESLEIQDRLGDLWGRAATLAMIGQISVHRGDIATGVSMLREAVPTLARMRSSDVEAVMRMLGSVRAAVGEEKFAAAWREVTGEGAIPEWVPEPANISEA